MPSFRKSLPLLTLIGVLSVAVLACNLNLPEPPKPPIQAFAPSEAEATAFEQNFAGAIKTAAEKGGPFTITINQRQLSSWLALRAANYARQQGYTIPVKDMQAALDNGKITLYGVVSQQNVPETSAEVTFTPSIDAQGQLAVDIGSARFGIVGVPNDLLANLTKTIKDTLNSQLASIKGRYRLTALTISGGNLSVTGQVTK